MTTFNDIHAYDAAWRMHLTEVKGYTSFHLDVEFEPVNDSVRVRCYWYDDSWSAVYPPKELKSCGRNNLQDLLTKLHTYILNIPHADSAKEQKLLEDFANIKERIAASRFSALFEAEMDALMKRMTENVIEDKRDQSNGEVV